MTREILVVEDEPDIRSLVVLHLERDGFRCRTAGTGAEAILETRARVPDLVVLDLMLPGLDGLEVCRQLRANPRTAAIPVVMLTAKTDEIDRVVGLELGADDYVTKPFSPKELVARVRAVLRRSTRVATEMRLAGGPVVMEPARHLVTLAGEPLTLTPREFELLRTLLEASGRVLSREQLLDRAWGYAHAGDVESRTVDVHVRRLRAKLGEEGRRIVTVKSTGYRFEME